MKTISFINQKGGVGKSAITKNVAYILAVTYGLRVLLIDNDKQGNISKFYNIEMPEKTIADILLNEIPAKEVIRQTCYKNLSIIPADMSLMTANIAITQDQEREQINRLKRSLQSIQGEYDICIIDNAPDINISILNVLIITDQVIAVALPDEDSIDGVKEMQNQIDLARKSNPTIQFRGIVMNQFVKTHHSFLMKKKLQKNFEVFRSNLRYTKDRLNVSTSVRIPIVELSPNCGFSRDIKQFVKELLYIK